MANALTVYPASRHEGRPLNPEVIDARIADVEAVARWLDYAFVLPGGFRYGLGGIIGLIPGIGDIFDALVSLYIVWRAIQLGVSRVTLTRMVVNVGIEAAVGAVPVLGAMFDTVFKANRRNYQLLASHLTGPKQQTAKDRWFLAVVAFLGLFSVAIPLFLVFELVKHL